MKYLTLIRYNTFAHSVCVPVPSVSLSGLRKNQHAHVCMFVCSDDGAIVQWCTASHIC